jgi:DNA-binding SARP family transcriptional activator/tetratricopeptide (TPR) repeat protein
MIRFYTLGAFELVEGEPPAVRLVPAQPKRLALLAYLALARPRGFHRRDTLLALFWPELPDDEGRRALRQALHHLRRALGESAIETRPDDQVRLAESGVWCDALAFEQCLAAGRPADAIGLYRNEFLRGVHVPEASAELDEWISRTRADLRDLAVRAAWVLVDRAEASGDIAGGVEAARLAHELAPEDEAGVRRYMRLLVRQGDRTQALALYDRLARRLATEYQTKPSPETATLARELRDPTPTPSAVDPRPQVFPVSLEGGVAPGGPLPSAGPLPPDASARRPARLPLRWLAATVALAGLGVLVGKAWAPGSPSLIATGQLARRDRVIIADFQNHTRDSLLAGLVTTGLRIELAQSPLVTVMSPAAVQAARRRLREGDPTGPLTEAVAHQVAVREGLKVVVEGDVSSVGAGWVISAQLVRAGGEPLVTVRMDAPDSTRLFDAIDRAARALRQRIGESSQALRVAPALSQVTTSSLEALRRYSDAQRAADVEGDRPKARLLLEEAVALDSTFAMAWRSLSALYIALGPPSAMVDAAARAYRHRDHLPARERHLVTAAYHDVVTREYDRVLRAYDEQLADTPDDPSILGAAAWMHFRLREFADAERLYVRSLAVDSTRSSMHFGLMESRINLGRLDAARAALAAFRRGFPGNPFAEWEEIYLAAATADLGAVETHARRLLHAAPDDADHRGEAMHTLASLAMARGRAEESAGLRRDAMRIYEQENDLGNYFGEALALATAEARLRGRPVEARRLVAEVLTRHPLDSLLPADRPYVELGIVYAELGDVDRAAGMQAELERHGLIRGRLAEGKWRRLRGAILLARRRYLEAQSELRIAAATEECALCALPALARSYDLGGRADSAVAVYQRYLRTPWMKRLELDAVNLGPTYLRLGQLHEAEGRRAEARTMYGRVSDLWRTGDAPFRAIAAQAVGRGEAE